MTKTIFESNHINPFGNLSGSNINYNDTYFYHIKTITVEHADISPTYYSYSLINRNDEMVAFINTEKQLTITKDETLNNDYKLCIS